MAGTTRPVLWVLCAVWVTVTAISVETPREVLRAARGRSVTLPCTYHTSVLERKGFIQWDKLLWSHSEKVLVWTFSTKDYVYGDLYENRVNLSGNAEQSNASITISQLTMDDNGTYECSISLLKDLGGTSKARVRLLVLVPPSKPDCSILGEAVIGNDIQLTCQSKEGSPAPQYHWRSFNLLNQERKGLPVDDRAGLPRPRKTEVPTLETASFGLHRWEPASRESRESGISTRGRGPGSPPAFVTSAGASVASASEVVGSSRDLMPRKCIEWLVRTEDTILREQSGRGRLAPGAGAGGNAGGVAGPDPAGDHAEESGLVTGDHGAPAMSGERRLVLSACRPSPQDGVRPLVAAGHEACSDTAPDCTGSLAPVLRLRGLLQTPGAGHTLTLRNISTDMSGYYICTSSNEVGTESCNITLTVRPPSMNVALYAGIAGGAVAVLIIIGVLVYCCCCREKGEDQGTRPNRSIYREPPEQLRELSRGREEEDDSRRQSPHHAAHA